MYRGSAPWPEQPVLASGLDLAQGRGNARGIGRWQVTDDLRKGRLDLRAFSLVALSVGDNLRAMTLAQRQWGNPTQIVKIHQSAKIGGGTSPGSLEQCNLSAVGRHLQRLH